MQKKKKLYWLMDGYSPNMVLVSFDPSNIYIYMWVLSSNRGYLKKVPFSQGFYEKNIGIGVSSSSIHPNAVTQSGIFQNSCSEYHSIYKYLQYLYVFIIFSSMIFYE